MKEKKITRSTLKSGDIICIPIFNIGYAYAKYFNIDKIFDIKSAYPDYMKFYVGIYPEKLENVLMINRETIIPPISIVTHTVVKRLGWEILTNESISEEEKIISDTKRGWPPIAYFSDEIQYTEWQYIRIGLNGETSLSDFVPYETIKHLPKSGILSAELIPIWIVIEHNKLYGKTLEDGLGVLGDNETFILDREKYRPCYALLDKSMRDKAIE
jgi:hypothetical protein